MAAARSFNSSFAPFGVKYILSNQIEHQLYIGRTFSCHASQEQASTHTDALTRLETFARHDTYI